MFIAVLFCTIYVSRAQKHTHIVSLLPNTTEVKEQVDFYIKDIIDNRVYKENIGIAQKGLLNKKVAAVFKKPFREELLQYFATIFPVTAKKTGLTVRINNLLISENTGAFKETGSALVNLDVLIKTDGGWRFLGNFSAEAEKNSMDVTGKHDDRIRAILKEGLLQFNKRDHKYMSDKYLSPKKPDTAAKIFKAPLKGYYLSFNEFYLNRPVQDTSISRQVKDTNLIRLRDKKGKHASYFGYCDGQDFYLNAQLYSASKHFVKCKRVEDFMLFNDVFINQNKVNGMALAFGIIGVLASNERSNALLDMHSGRIKVLTRKSMKTLLKTNDRPLYKQYQKSPNATALMQRIITQIIDERGREYLMHLP